MVIHFLRVIDEVHLVDRDDKVLDTQQIGDEAVTLGLLDHTLARIDQNDGEVCCRGTSHHVAGVLNVARSIGDDEFALWRSEVAIGDIDGDALFALGLETISQQGEVDVFIATFA